MDRFTVTCPACGNSFACPIDLETVFCTSCRKKLRLKVTVECTAEDDPTSTTSSLQCGISPSTPGVASFSQEQSFAMSRFIVRIHMPDRPLRLKGSFGYFGTKWDDTDLGNSGPRDVLELNTTGGTHNLEIRQLNNSLIGNGIKKTTVQVRITSNKDIFIEAGEGEFLVH